MRTSLAAFAVEGESMTPALRPGDLLVVRRGAEVGIGDLVVARDPREPARLIVKRIVFRAEGGWWLESDNQDAPGRRDSWDFDAVPDRLIVGRAVARYWPPSRLSLSASALSRRRAR
jgi:nickel-type superoxide dismutase maturation protease